MAVATENVSIPLLIPPTNENGESVIYNVKSGSTVVFDEFSAPLPDYSSRQHLAVVQVDGKPHSPWQKVEFQVPEEPTADLKNPDEKHTLKFKSVPPPIFKDLSQYTTSKQAVPLLLTPEELQYFKNFGNNALVFVHGFNVAAGMYSNWIEKIKIIETSLQHRKEPHREIQADISYLLFPLCRTWSELQQQFPDIPAEPCPINGIDHDTFLNGTEAHNWALHMEYNLNCAAAGQYPFDWLKHGLDYTRIINIHWPGDVGGVNYLNAEKPAYLAGLGLVNLLQQLQEAGITINLIAHSLGSRVALTALETLAQQGMTNIVEHLFLWESAVPSNALSPLLKSDPQADKFPTVNQAANKITVLYSSNDPILEYAYRLAQGQRVVGFPITSLELPQIIALGLDYHPALGSVGPEIKPGTVEGGIFQAWEVSGKLILVNQGTLLESHGAMRIPTPELFEEIYVKKIMKAHGMKFGKYPGVGTDK